MLEEAVRRLEERTARYTAEGDASVLRTQDAQADVDAVLEAMSANGLTPEVACVLGVFLFHRCETNPETRTDDALLTLDIFSHIPDMADALPRRARNSAAHIWNDRATALLQGVDGVPPDLRQVDEAIRLYCIAVLMLGPGHAMASIVAARAGTALMRRFRMTGVATDLDEAIDRMRSPLEDPQQDDERTRAACLVNLGTALRLRFSLRGALEDLSEAVLRWRDARQLESAALEPLGRLSEQSSRQPSVQRAVPPHLGDEFVLACALLLHWKGVADPLLISVREHMTPTEWEAVTQARPPGWQWAQPAGEALRHASTTGDLVVLDHALALLLNAAEVCQRGSADHLAVLRRMESALMSRLSLTDDLEDASELAIFARLNVDLAAATPDLLIEQLPYLTASLRACHRHSRLVPLLDEAIDWLQYGLEHVGPGHPAWGTLHSNLGVVYQDRYAATDDDADGAAAEAALRSALAHLPADQSDRPRLEERLVRVQLSRGTLDDVESALTRQRKKVGDGSDAVSNPDDRILLGLLLTNRASRSGSAAGWEEAAAEIERLIAMIGHQAEDFPEHASALSTCEWELYQLTGEQARLDRAVTLAEWTLDAFLPDHPDGATAASNLCNLLADRAYATGSLDDVHAAVAYGRKAIALSLEPDPAAIVNLAKALSERFRLHGNLADLDEAIALCRTTDDESAIADSPAVQGSLALHLAMRHDETHRAEDLAEAIEVGRGVIRDERLPGPRRAGYHSNHAAALLTRHRLHHDMADLDEAVATARQALALVGPSAPDRSTFLSHLAGALAERHAVRPAEGDLHEAIDCLRTAIDATPEHHSDFPRLLHNLATLLGFRDGRSSAAPDEAMEVWRRAASLTAHPTMRLRVALDWGAEAAARDNWEQALDAYTTAVGLLPQLAWIGLGRTDQQRLLAKASGLASDAAASALFAGRPERAVEVLEQARAVLFTGEWQWTADVAALRAIAPDLADQLTDIREQLGGQLVDESASGLLDAARGAGANADARMALGRRWDEAVDAARRLPGLVAFLRDRPSPVLELPENSAAVIVNVSRYRCDALLITDHDVRVVPLGVSAREIADVAVSHLVMQSQHAYETSFKATAPAAALAREHSLTETLAWLWEHIARPVLDALGHTGPPAQGQPWPRVWWCPTSMLTHLPLHAAGGHESLGAAHGASDEPARDSVMDRVVSSYTPTLRALATALTTPARHTEPRLLSVAPEPPDQRALPGAQREARALSTWVSGARLTSLHGSQATVRAVKEALPHHTWVHFSCHGDQSITDPSTGGLILHDGRLTVADLVRARHPDSVLAFLAACKSASGGAAVPDEVLTPAAAFQYAGFRHVIGTMWAIDDDAASDLTERMYSDLFQHEPLDARDTAPALHRAVRDMRNASPYRPSTWASVVHLGA